MRTYASLAAYLTHWRALARGTQTPADANLLAEMNRVIVEILGDERRYLVGPAADSSAERHRARAEAMLRHELIARGVLAE